MPNEIATTEPTPPSQSSSLLAQIVEASKNPEVDADKMRSMADLAIQLQDREMQQQFNRDLNAAIADMPVITKAGRIVIKDKNTGAIIQETAYEKFEDLDRVVKPIARRHNIQYNFDVGYDENWILVFIILRHTNGYVERSSPMRLPIEDSGSKNKVQGSGSTQTFGKRYALKNAFAISVEGEDDDGNLGQTVRSRMPNERATVVLEEALAAHEAGRYNEWFRAQSPKDRSFLVTSGKHAEYGGEPALPAPRPEPLEKKEPTPTPEPKTSGRPSGSQRASPGPNEQARMRDEWVAGYCAKVAQTASLDALTELQDKHRANLDRFHADYPDQWARISEAHSAAIDRFHAGNQDDSGGSDLFNEGEG